MGSALQLEPIVTSWVGLLPFHQTLKIRIFVIWRLLFKKLLRDWDVFFVKPTRWNIIIIQHLKTFKSFIFTQLYLPCPPRPVARSVGIFLWRSITRPVVFIWWWSIARSVVVIDWRSVARSVVLLYRWWSVRRSVGLLMCWIIRRSDWISLWPIQWTIDLLWEPAGYN